MRFLEVVMLFRLSLYMRPFQEPDPEHTFKPGSTLKEWVIPTAPADRPQPKQRLYIVLTMLACLTDLINPDSQWKLHLAEIMDQQELGYLRLMGFPNDWKRQQQWCLE
ncbi:hypothetical protein [Pseudomonas sp. R5(2019)]|uniref:hypothetical protein n=1 Tax=Pseudomonas sp. R5(2019) TaxID=2697566 RepID=UPI002114B72D|nr:hypothetical protein [Pseudomonas sp. R5(2019)]